MARIAYLLVLYRCRLNESAAWQSLHAHLPLTEVLVVDNSPEPQPVPVGLLYLHRPDNPGISIACNLAFRILHEKGFRCLHFSDQDTQYPPETPAAYQQALKQAPDIGLWFPRLWQDDHLLSPALYKRKRGYFFTGEKPAGTLSLHTFSPINSGLMVDIDKALSVGGYNEKVRLDFADFAFIERFRTSYPHGFCLPLDLRHSLSDFDHKTEEQILTRYKLFCDSARGFADSSTGWFWLSLWVLKRALKNTLRFRTAAFIRVAVRTFFLKKTT